MSAPRKLVHFYYSVIDTHTQKEVNRINRQEGDILYDQGIFQIMIHPKDPNSALFLLFKDTKVQIAAINLLSGKHKIIHENPNCTQGTPAILKMTESGQRVYIAYQGYVND